MILDGAESENSIIQQSRSDHRLLDTENYQLFLLIYTKKVQFLGNVYTITSAVKPYAARLISMN